MVQDVLKHGSVIRPALAMATALLLVGLVSSVADAQTHCSEFADTSDAALAARFAPVLRFAPSEPYFPTMPFFCAFDRQDNDGDGLIDFEDLDEIAFLSPGDSLSASWDVLDNWYAKEMARLSPDPDEHPPVPPVPAVLYRVRPLSEHERNSVRRFLKNVLSARRRSHYSRIS